jgi:hypothetical protein
VVRYLEAIAVNASATLNSSKARELAELEATGSRGQLHPSALHSQVADLRIEDSQNLPERKLQ